MGDSNTNPGLPAPVAAACHCKTVRFQVRLTDGLKTARRCTCSYCRMRGAIAVSAELGDITFLAGENALSRYSFNTGTAQHYFCSKCGIYTHHQRRSNPTQYGINVACLEGVSPFDFAEVPVMDGVHHPTDGGPGAKGRVAGVLRFIPADDPQDNRPNNHKASSAHKCVGTPTKMPLQTGPK